MGKKITRENILEHLIEKQFNIIEKTTIDALFNKNFKEEWSITQKEYNKYQKYAVLLMMKTFKIPKTKAKRNFEWLMVKYGLKIK